MGRPCANRSWWSWSILAMLAGAPGCQVLAPMCVNRCGPLDQRCAEAESSGTEAANQTPSGGNIRLAAHREAAAPEDIDSGDQDVQNLEDLGSRVQGAEESARDLTLMQVIQLAQEANPDLRSASERLQLADALLARARAEFYPRLSIGEDYGVTNTPVNVFSFFLNQGRLSLNRDFNNPPTLADFHTQVLVQQGLYAGGKRLAQVGSAEAQRSASGFARAALQNGLIYRVAEAYYRLLQARDLVLVREEAVKQVQQHLDIVRVRFDAGTAVKSDVLSVDVRLAEVQESLITARNQLELAWAVLENVTGAPIARRALPEKVPAAPWSQHVDQIEAAVAEALQRRPELSGLANRRLAARYDVTAARAGNYATVDLVGDYDVFTAGDFEDSKDSFFVGVMARLTLFDGGRTRGDVRQAVARVRELVAQERRLALDIELEVRRAYLQLTDARERVEVADRAVAQAEESLREIEVRYQGQTATITQLIDAQVALSNSRVRRASAHAELEIARAALEQAIGRLLDVVRR